MLPVNMWVLCVLCVLATSPLTVSSSVTHDTRLLDDVLEGLEKVINFFSEDYSVINLDGLFGLRTTEGTLLQSLSWCSERKCPDHVTNKLRQLQHSIADTANKSLTYVQAGDPEYYSRFHLLTDTPFLLNFTNMFLDKSQVVIGTDQNYNEAKGDDCYTSLFGTYNEHTAKCTATEECLQYMTRGNVARYGITHQLLYFIMAEKVGCAEVLTTKLAEHGLNSLKDTEKQLCQNIFAEAKNSVKNGNVKEKDQDIFLERCVLCGLLGFQEFLQPDWLKMVLSWQTTQGCFSDNEREETNQNKRFLKLLRGEARKIDSKPHSTQRRLQREQHMTGDCLAHKSGLGASALGVYQRLLISTIPWH